MALAVGPRLETELDERIARLARMPQLLVACDYDGTIAPIVDDPMAARPRRETVVAMRALADLPQTNVAVISGRSLRDLAALSRLPDEIRLVGSHGSEFEVGFASELSAGATALRTQIEHAVADVASRTEGAYVEYKPTGVAFHYRMVDPDAACLATEEIREGPGSLPGVHARQGNQVLELSVVETDKGAALETIRRQLGSSAVLFIGDDVTDEDAFATLGGPDLGIKVGSAPSQAEFRVDDTGDVARVLALLAQLRTSWLMGSAAPPIESHSMLSDQRTAAIVSPEARITWLCSPRIDSAAVFAELVGGPAAGYFSVRPVEGAMPTSQHYVRDSLVLVSTWPQMTVTDYLDCSAGRPLRTAGRSDLIRFVEGSGTAVVEFAPRLDFGRVPTRLEVREGGLEVLGTTDMAVLRSPGVRWEIVDDGVHHTGRALIDLDEGPVVLEMRCGTGSMTADQAEGDRRRDTLAYWENWAAELDLPTIERDLVRRSAVVLKGLVHEPTGAIVAAATTSLPESLGGVRNWDYRYCWLRDAAMTAGALTRLGSSSEAMNFLDWVLDVLETRGGADRLAPLFLVTGRHLPPEAEIAELPGYAGSRPVRVGNAAEGQVQLDVFGPVVDLVHLLLRRGAPLSGQHWKLVESLAEAVIERWDSPDHGIWEIRKHPRHHVYSKVMCWLTLDRAIEMAGHFTGRKRPEWTEVRDTIAGDVVTHGWKPELNYFGSAYDGTDIDASVLSIGLSGLLPADDPRFVATVEAVERQLRDGPTVYRYRSDDGLPGTEGGFHLMTSWLVDAYRLVGRRQDAVKLFAGLCDLVGPTGLLSEEYDPVAGRALGNLPQAYSHLGLINNALNLDGRDT